MLMAPHLRRALSLSNHAVKLLLLEGIDNNDEAKRRFEMALSYFSESLQEIKRLLLSAHFLEAKDHHDTSSILEMSDAKEPCLATTMQSLSYSDNEGSSASSPTNKNNENNIAHNDFITFSHCPLQELCNTADNGGYVYNQAVYFHLNQDCSSLSCDSCRAPRKDDIDMYSSFIMLNIALTYQRQAIRLARLGKVCQSAAWFQKAEILYDIVVQKLHSKVDNIPFTATTHPLSSSMVHLSETVLRIKAAAVNNLSQLLFHRCEFMKSFAGFQFLGSILRDAIIDWDKEEDILSTTHQTATRTARSSSLNNNDAKIFRQMLENVFFLHPPTRAAAA